MFDTACNFVPLYVRSYELCDVHVTLCFSHFSSQAAKICNNMLLAIGMIGTAETMNLGIRYKWPVLVFIEGVRIKLQ